MFNKINILALAALIVSIAPPTLAHTWIEEYQVIGPNGSYIGDRGYSRGYVARTDPTFNGDANILWLLPQATSVMPDGGVRLRVNASDSLCHPNQRTSNYTDPRYPKLKAAPGSFVAMKYLENGHVTLPWNQKGKPLDGGTVYVFGTNRPSSDEKIANVMKWNTEGTGGDKRGWLLSAQNFDDGRCHQINSCTLSVGRQAVYPNMIPDQNATAEQWCESDVRIPQNVKPGTLTTYWVWQWPTEPEQECIYPEGKDEYYTTCADFEIVGDSPGDVKIVEEVATNTLLQENFQTQAVETYMARTARVTPSVILENWNLKIASTFKVNPVWSSSCNASLFSAQQSASAAGFPAIPPPLCPSGKWATGTLSAIVAESALAAAKTAGTGPQITATPTPPETAPPIATGGPTGSAAPSQPSAYVPAPSNGTPPPPAMSVAPSGDASKVTMVTTYTQFVTVPAGGSTPPASAAPSDPAMSSAPAAPSAAVTPPGPPAPPSAPPMASSAPLAVPSSSATVSSAPLAAPSIPGSPYVPAEPSAPASPYAPATTPVAASPQAASGANDFPTVLTIPASSVAASTAKTSSTTCETSSVVSPESAYVDDNGMAAEHVARHARRAHARHFS
ncbi:hypothetical protein LTR09_011487 [Extremus antarcticus]|uniref:DUF7492 domain-containing protein n=1 Tax=Extremus antarcticus TaxID=702011 RepID=A0AAJ0D6A0_9PEZI|nr:hypothetical protein LTR09_011487 [Extremus antarcticus]